MKQNEYKPVDISKYYDPTADHEENEYSEDRMRRFTYHRDEKQKQLPPEDFELWLKMVWEHDVDSWGNIGY